ncbi:hypothetical protein VP01_1526g4 [Puccinia sorghi]|uniref:Uncharacterized protein n=1 Tax=Puccinia sorghi TaxID=27349 RepID=A0A0L6VIU6_9BASI|nr:hypothetical protein VP01_1526g4 [Puccinia sorghi]
MLNPLHTSKNLQHSHFGYNIFKLALTMAYAAEIRAILSVALTQQEQHLQEQLASRDKVIPKLMSKVGLDDKTPKSTKPRAPKQLGLSQANKGKASTSQGLGSLTSIPIRTNGPLPFRTDALYIHIKIIWNLLKQKAIPGPPYPSTLTKFNSCFLDAEKISQTVENMQAAALVPLREIVTLKALKIGRRKIGKGVTWTTFVLTTPRLFLLAWVYKFGGQTWTTPCNHCTTRRVDRLPLKHFVKLLLVDLLSILVSYNQPNVLERDLAGRSAQGYV